jgi:hypothetical protein
VHLVGGARQMTVGEVRGAAMRAHGVFDPPPEGVHDPLKHTYQAYLIKAAGGPALSVRSVALEAVLR